MNNKVRFRVTLQKNQVYEGAYFFDSKVEVLYGNGTFQINSGEVGAKAVEIHMEEGRDELVLHIPMKHVEIVTEKDIE